MQISVIGVKTSRVSHERAACANVVSRCFHSFPVVFVHLCVIKGSVDTRSGPPAAPVWLWLPLTRPVDLKQLQKRHRDSGKTIPPL